MSISEVDVCNMALDNIGARYSITSLTPPQPAPNAIMVARHYQPKIDALLRAAHWNFARKQATLTLLDDVEPRLKAMRRILIERARRKLRLKRGNRAEHLSIENVDVAQTEPDERILLIDEALTRLTATDPELARIVTLKFFGGLTNAEVAETFEVTERTIHNKWTFAKAWLLKSIREEWNFGS